MATLEKIRSKSVLLLIIIGAALIAFIIGDFFTSGRTFFGTGTTVAKVGSHKIDVQEFQRRVEQANQQAQQNNQKVDQAALQQQVLNAMIAEKLYRQELSDLGLTVTDAELSDAMLGSGSAYLDRMIQQQTGLESAAQLHDMAFNPVKYGLDEQQALQLRAYWLQLEQQMEETLLQQKFQTLFAGTLVANQLDARALYDDNIATRRVAYVKKDFTSLNNDDYQVSSDEVRDAWNKQKGQYLIPEETRTISYIDVEITPSREDMVAAEQKVENAIAQLNTLPDTEGVNSDIDFVVDRRKQVISQIRDNQLKKFVDTTAVGRAGLVSRIGNDFTLGKVLGRSNEVDSVNIDFIVLAGTQADVDSMLRAVNAAGSGWMNVVSANPNVQGTQEDMWVSLIDPNITSLREQLLSCPTGTFFTPDSVVTQGARLFRVNQRKAPVAVADIAVISYKAEPSRATVNQLESALQSFLNANPTAEDFVKNAQDAGYAAIPTQVTASTPQIGRFPDTRAVVSWAMDAKKGQVSGIIGEESNGRLLSAALTDIYDDYVPARDPQVNMALTTKVRNDKKAAALIEQYKGKGTTLADYAQAMDSRIDSTRVNFGQMSAFMPGIGGSEVAARVALAPAGAIVGPMQANSGVVVVEVVEVDDQGRPYNYEESANLYSRTRGAAALGNALPRILQGNQKITNNLLKFYRN